MQVLRQVMVGVVAVSALAGCASIKDHRGYLVDQALVDSVQPGIDNKLSVERTLGRPTFISQFGEPVWYYVAIDTHQAAFTRPRPYNELALKVHFDQAGNVARLEKTGMEKVVILDPDGHVTPTLGAHRTFLEDLFGNIGTVGSGLGAQGPNGDNTGGQ
ncbi:outer membrane protein assembly factor BamE [Novosphingobium flavum]|uniref:Outer membrane protein assembly factor BamE n=1 Tax=Novosphingobium flavum TaxID=1778672 RepID=A0A7X1FS89_9SPHN|nr:outer membrane protein assembly factor BamE [Novosphingobium flavum]MBC2666035.1 outer membrane protein assembly factor BamE [Novosphingobium flavum]